MPGVGHEYSTKASVTALPSTADFAFHFSAAIRRKEEPHGAGFEADTSGLLFACQLGRSGNGFGGRGSGRPGYGTDGPSRLRSPISRPPRRTGMHWTRTRSFAPI